MGNDQAKIPNWGQLNFCSLSGTFLVFLFTFCRISCSKYFFLLASTMRYGEEMAGGEYLSKKLKT